MFTFSDTDIFTEIYELGNGCICCSSSGEFEKTLAKLLEKRDVIDHIVIETTGLAVPEPITRVFTNDPEFSRELLLSSIVTVVDAHHFLDRLNDERKKDNDIKNEALEQVNSDFIIFPTFQGVSCRQNRHQQD